MRNNFKLWIKCAAIRSIKTIAQATLGAIGGAALFSEVDWAVVGSTALLAGIFSLLTSVAGIPEAEVVEENTNDVEKGED